MKRPRRLTFILVLVTLMSIVSGRAYCQAPPYTAYMNHPWVDSVLSSLSMEQRVAQSVFLTTGPDRGLSHYLLIEELIRDAGAGGLLVRPGTASSPEVRISNEDLIRYFRSVSRVPLAVALEGGAAGTPSPDPSAEDQDLSAEDQDLSAEGGYWPGGPAFRDFPGPWTLAAAGSDSLAGQLGEALSRLYSRTGAQLVLTPASGLSLPSLMKDRFAGHGILLLENPSPAPGDSEGSRRLAEAGGLEGVTVVPAYRDPERIRAEFGALLLREAADTAAINRTARRVLAFKYWAGLQQELQAENALKQDALEEEAPEEDAPTEDCASCHESAALVRELYARSLTVLSNRQGLIPLRGLDTLRIACLSIDPDLTPAAGQDPFQEMASRYTRVDPFRWKPGKSGADSLLEALAGYDVVLVGTGPGATPREGEGIRDLLSALAGETQLITVLFGDPDRTGDWEGPLFAEGTGSSEGTGFMEAMGSSGGLVLAYRHTELTGQLAAQLIFGGIGGNGKLPCTIDTRFQAGSGIPTPGGLRLQYAPPESAGISSVLLNHKIDSVVLGGLQAGAFPGCEVIAARNGKVIFHKTYGYQTYDQRIEVRKGDLYDLASVTKVSGPLAGLMVLEGMGRFSHNDLLGKYVPAMRGSDKAGLWLKDILAHQAGLYPWIPYWQQTVKRNGQFKRRLMHSYPSEKFSMTVADHLYLKDRFRKSIYRTIRKSELGEKKYLYSGLAFFLFPGVIEDLSGERYEDFLSGHIYHRLGAWDLVYNPLRSYPLSRIAPTEYDSLFRRQLIHGYVHDESAATMGGFSGNAGLFATAGDLLKLVEMYRRMGSYGGEQIIPEEVLKEYTSYQFPESLNRRGLGFDKPLLDGHDGTPDDYPCPGASPSSFGHSGFTGTFVWADPAYGISYVFLSNRVYPTRNNNLISDMNIRTEVLQAIYDSIVEE